MSLLFLSSSTIYAQSTTTFQSPYRLSWEVDGSLAGATLGMGTTYFILNRKMPSLDSAYIGTLHKSMVKRFDRSACNNWSRGIAKASDVMMFTSMATPSLLFIDKNIRKDYLKVGTIWAQTFFLTAGVTNLTKVLVKRKRPFVYNPDVPMHYKLKKDAQYSFFSGHTSVTSSMCFMTAKIYTDYNPKSKALPYVWAGAAIIPAVTGYFRYRAGKHFWSDILIGYLVGATVGILVPELHKIGVR